MLYELALDERCDLNQADGDGKTAVHLAAEAGLFKTVVHFVNFASGGRGGRGLNLNRASKGHRTTPLISAAARNHTGIVQFLAGRPEVDVNAVKRNGDSALHVAAYFGFKAAVEILMEREDVLMEQRNGLNLTQPTK